ncbi:50S ribosomal protein L21 [Truepera radiovictrix]|uniref:Large ribosomal subunit protein bL21 n=1 Tax=Truepera radiovictrix (strain DSM 17093 / CIP 108686 / LMG 22925 / RQ-24) TaxID=649638 RepID=D7CWS4_TRURR|nr:50S ribosomal protein L21 [Truepera radiovictrix]ADI13165.1 ribosomal protein L21 [Truepera radiovictrix DSM 17093]WMT58266.1 50S ribosomal protein L21 [Truepera radiovictrix]
MFAIIQSGGKQYRVAEGDVVRLEALAAEPGETVELPVMMVAGDEIKVGAPLVDGASVRAEVLGHGRGKKLYIYKFKAKSNYRRKTGHRQNYTEVRITHIAG